MNRPKVSIVIVNWNGKHYLDACLSSVLNQTYKNFEIIMVDNASIDGSVEYVQTKYPSIKIIQTSEDLGFAKGCNIGMRASNADYVVALSNDTRVEPNWLGELVKVAKTDEKIGICGSKLLLMDMRDIYNSAGFFIIWNAFIYDRAPGKKVGKYEKLEQVNGVCLASALLRKEMLDEIGLLDERFFFGHDDVDLCWRAKNAGWKAMYVPASVCYHKMLGSGQKLDYRFVVDAVWVISKNSNLLGLAGIAIYYFVAMMKAIVWKAFGKDKDYKPFFNALRAIPCEWKKGKPYREAREKNSKMFG
ncbi:MAG: glycosyltransferase family 2 protein [Candidatus Methanoperedens sp.]|nr:glycosyltransferase family 2 protein [Candidatus Methanoperedens sp.]MCE8428759.1 glycosyltransferase family 2 protein [Candidatus Methanoperedens sp.]